ncbi:MAG: hypothetical protein K8T91_21420 [Planctomycetes bacterium]|nr:hypothetical protein [Planctomycetota bacterium]
MIKIRTEDKLHRVADAAKKAAFRNFGHAAASIRKDAMASIERSDAPSEPGEPPHTAGGLLPRSIAYAVDENGAVIGPRASVVGQAGAAHEHGETFHGDDFPQREFMGPALDRAIPRIGGEWKGSIGE